VWACLFSCPHLSSSCSIHLQRGETALGGGRHIWVCAQHLRRPGVMRTQRSPVHLWNICSTQTKLLITLRSHLPNGVMKWRYSPAAKPEKGERGKEERYLVLPLREDRYSAKLFGIISTSREVCSVHTVHYSAMLWCNVLTDTVKNSKVFP